MISRFKHTGQKCRPDTRPYFTYANTQEIRVVDIDGEPWWVAKDICDVLELKKVDRAIASLDDDEKGTHIVSTPGGNQEMTVINEPGLYSLILRSRKPEAKKFKRWITHEVIPTIRKTGGTYMTDDALQRTLEDPDYMIGVLQKMKELKKERDWAVLRAKQESDRADTAEATKAHINNKKTATAMGRLSGAKRRIKALEEKYESPKYLATTAIKWLKVAQEIKELHKRACRLMGTPWACCEGIGG